MEPTGWEMRPMGWIVLAIFTVLALYLLQRWLDKQSKNTSAKI